LAAFNSLRGFGRHDGKSPYSQRPKSWDCKR
jgi:hypothetical protein